MFGIIVVAHRWYPWGWSLLLVICVSVRGSLRKPVSRIGGCECLGHEETHRGLLYLPPVLTRDTGSRVQTASYISELGLETVPLKLRFLSSVLSVL